MRSLAKLRINLDDADALETLKGLATDTEAGWFTITRLRVSQLRDWISQEDREGRLCTWVKEQDLAKLAADAASISLKKLATLSSSATEVSHSLLVYFKETLISSGIILSGTSNFGPCVPDTEQLTYRQAVRDQASDTDLLGSLAAASIRLATAIINNLQPTNTCCTKQTAVAGHKGDDVAVNSRTSSTLAQPTSKHKQSRQQKSRQDTTTATSSANITQNAEAAVSVELGCAVLQLWTAVQRSWHNPGCSASSPSESAPSLAAYTVSVTDLMPTVPPTCQLALAVLRYYSSQRSGSRMSKDVQNCAQATSAAFVITLLLSQLVSQADESPIAGLCDMLTDKHVMGILLYMLASNTYILWRNRLGQSSLLLSEALLGASGASSSSTAQKQQHCKQQQHQQHQLVLGVADHHMQLLQLLELGGLPPDKYDKMKSGRRKDKTLSWEEVAADNAQTTVTILRKLFDGSRHFPVDDQLPSTTRSDVLGLPLYTAVVRVLLQLLLLTPDATGNNRVASCMLSVAVAARPDYAAVTDSAEAAAAVRSILAPMMLQGVLVMQHALEQRDINEDSKAEYEGLYAFLLKQLLIQDPLPADAYKQIWASIFSEAPFTAVVSLDVTSRLIGRRCSDAPTPGRSMHRVLDAAAAHQQLLGATAMVSAPNNTGLAARIVSLMVSCVKYSQQFADIRALELAAAVASAAQKFAAACNSSSGNTSSSKGCIDNATAVPWLHVAARAVLACGQAFLRSPATGEPADSEDTWQEQQAAAISAVVTLNSRGQHTVVASPEEEAADTFIEAAGSMPSQQEFQCFDEFDSQFHSLPGGIPSALEYVGNPTRGWQCSDLSDILQRLSDAAGWCGKLLQQLDAAFSSSSGTAVGTSSRKLQEQSQQLQEVLAAAVAQWKGQEFELAQQSGGTYASGSSWMMLLRARQVVGYKLADQLQQYAVELCAVLPTTLCCNNPSCDNLSGVSELSCVGRRKCSRCQAAGYCSRECQTQHWSKHKVVCRELCKGDS